MKLSCKASEILREDDNRTVTAVPGTVRQLIDPSRPDGYSTKEWTHYAY